MGLSLELLVDLCKFVIEKKCKKICMIGKQDIEVDLYTYNNVMKNMGFDIPKLEKEDAYELFKNLPGVERVSALDYSDYEQADIIFS